jgi:alkanesulfonate monooxygenase SsuD/methylene tetrahydromethanopterin reductase-like flavin-dependent oxidoreductase (luciferase family)
MRRLWTEDNVTFNGRFTTLPGVTLEPKPVQRPHPPIWISGRSDAAMKRCAKFGTGWLPYMYTPEKLANSLETIRAYGERESRETAVSPGLFIFFAVHEDRDTAIKMATDRLSAQYNQDFSALVGKYALAGNPEDCINRLQEYIDAGAGTVILNSACPGLYMAENEKLFAERVLSAFRKPDFNIETP